MLDRASEQVTELYAKVREFTTLHKYEVVREHNSELGLNVLRMKIMGAPPLPKQFALLVGEFSNSLRGALDHLVWAFIKGTPKGDKRIEFPIFDTPGRFEAEREKKNRSLAHRCPRRNQAIAALSCWGSIAFASALAYPPFGHFP